MDKIITIWQTGQGRAVSARELHNALKVGKDFST